MNTMHYLKFLNYFFSLLYAWEKNDPILHREHKCSIYWFGIHPQIPQLYLEKEGPHGTIKIVNNINLLVQEPLVSSKRLQFSHTPPQLSTEKALFPKVNDEQTVLKKLLCMYVIYTHGWMISWIGFGTTT